MERFIGVALEVALVGMIGGVVTARLMEGAAALVRLIA
jgi:hypothetical protein